VPIDLHLICPRGHMLSPVESGLLVPVGDGFNIDLFETGDWAGISKEEADEAVGGRLYLHVAQAREPWQGGTILSWRVASVRPASGRWHQYQNGQQHATKIFRFWGDVPLVINCKWHGRVGFNRREREEERCWPSRQ
jgi:hypothetical protein